MSYKSRNELISDGIFQLGSNKSLLFGTVLWKWVHLEHNPLVNAEYAA